MTEWSSVQYPLGISGIFWYVVKAFFFYSLLKYHEIVLILVANSICTFLKSFLMKNKQVCIGNFAKSLTYNACHVLFSIDQSNKPFMFRRFSLQESGEDIQNM